MNPMTPLKPMEPMEPLKPMTTGSQWWPEGLDHPRTSGSQDGWRYAYFPRQRRLVVDQGGQVSQYDTGDHAISRVSQGHENAGPVFTSQHGTVALEELRKL